MHNKETSFISYQQQHIKIYTNDACIFIQINPRHEVCIIISSYKLDLTNQVQDINKFKIHLKYEIIQNTPKY